MLPERALVRTDIHERNEKYVAEYYVAEHGVCIVTLAQTNTALFKAIASHYFNMAAAREWRIKYDLGRDSGAIATAYAREIGVSLPLKILRRPCLLCLCVCDGLV